ncbi:MAG TPA: hypothetical protein VHA34_09255, partial [Actinomycetes bacterium]|nr:hypothetical protein [Actinomycetes bacterium]
AGLLAAAAGGHTRLDLGPGADARSQLGHHLFGQAVVGAAGAGLGAVRQGVDGGGELAASRLKSRG